LRKSCPKLPITNSQKAKIAEKIGVENDENNNASAVMIMNCNTMKGVEMISM
jgi:hypothetical protein